MKLYTRTGDDGSTGLHGGERVKKTHPRVAAYGECDELNAWLGLVRASLGSNTDAEAGAGGRHAFIAECLDEAQRLLFEIGADLATPGESRARKKVSPATADDIARLEGWIDEVTDQVEPQRSFILPGGSESAARLHVARTVCRRAERAIVSLTEQEGGDAVESNSLIWMNRLSDLLFALARLANHIDGVADTPWTPRAQGPQDGSIGA